MFSPSFIFLTLLKSLNFLDAGVNFRRSHGLTLEMQICIRKMKVYVFMHF